MIEKAHHLGTETGLEMQRTTELHLEHLEACLSDLMGVLLSYSHDLSYSADFKSGWVYGSNCSFWPSLRLPIHSSLSVSLFLAAYPPLKQGDLPSKALAHNYSPAHSYCHSLNSILLKPLFILQVRLACTVTRGYCPSNQNYIEKSFIC